MPSINVSLSDELCDFVNEQVSASSYTSSSEYLRQLIREHREAVRFRKLIDEGASSPIEGTFDKAYFDDLRVRARSRDTRGDAQTRHSPAASPQRRGRCRRLLLWERR